MRYSRQPHTNKCTICKDKLAQCSPTINTAYNFSLVDAKMPFLNTLYGHAKVVSLGTFQVFELHKLKIMEVVVFALLDMQTT